MRRLASVLLVAAASVALAGQTDQVFRKPGLWQIIWSTGPTGAPAMTMCVDAATDAVLHKYAMGVGTKTCSKNDVKIGGKQITIDSVCPAAGTQITAHSITTFTGDTAFHTVIAVHYQPPMMGESDTTMTQDGKWTGPCPADMKPGDMIGASGRKVNLNDMMGQ
jgi:hypothetical protein